MRGLARANWAATLSRRGWRFRAAAQATGASRRAWVEAEALLATRARRRALEERGQIGAGRGAGRGGGGDSEAGGGAGGLVRDGGGLTRAGGGGGSLGHVGQQGHPGIATTHVCNAVAHVAGAHKVLALHGGTVVGTGTAVLVAAAAAAVANWKAGGGLVPATC